MAKHIPRIYCNDLSDVYFTIPPFQFSHLISVLRLKVGDQFLAFNPDMGEWLCQISKISKKEASGERMRFLRSFEPKPIKLGMAFCIIKKDNVRLLIEKGTELGVTDFFPLYSDYVSNNCDIDKLNSVAISASEQSERLDIPNIHPIQNLEEFLQRLPSDFSWFSAIERSQDLKSIADIALENSDSGFIIGPEGGFSPKEKELLIKNSTPFCLSKNILRSETAAITCLAVFNAKNL